MSKQTDPGRFSAFCLILIDESLFLNYIITQTKTGGMRDENAGQNLKQYGVNTLKNSGLERPGELVEMSSVEESMKQESYDF